MTYKDMTFCVGDECAKFPSCFRALTDIVEANAKKMGLPICQFTAPKSLDCYEPKNKKEHSAERALLPFPSVDVASAGHALSSSSSLFCCDPDNCPFFLS